MEFGLRSTGTPNNSLMKLSNLEAKELLEVEKSDIIEALGHVIYTPGIIGMNNFYWFTLTLVPMGAIQLGHAETFRNIKAFNSSITIDTHCADMDHMAFGIELHHGDENILGAESVVGVSIIDSINVFHRIGSRLELSKVNDHIRSEFLK